MMEKCKQCAYQTRSINVEPCDTCAQNPFSEATQDNFKLNKILSDSTENQIKVRVNNGYLIAKPTTDPAYPGIVIEFVGSSIPQGALSAPTVLVECPQDGVLQAFVWSDSEREDYNIKTIFEQKEGVNYYVKTNI